MGSTGEATDPVVVREVHILPCQLIELRNQILLTASPQFLGQEAGFHGFQINVDQIPFFLGKGNFHISRGSVFLLIDSAVGEKTVIYVSGKVNQTSRCDKGRHAEEQEQPIAPLFGEGIDLLSLDTELAVFSIQQK